MSDVSRYTPEQVVSIEEEKLIQRCTWFEANSCHDLKCLAYRTMHDELFSELTGFANKYYGVNSQEWINEVQR